MARLPRAEQVGSQGRYAEGCTPPHADLGVMSAGKAHSMIMIAINPPREMTITMLKLMKRVFRRRGSLPSDEVPETATANLDQYAEEFKLCVAYTERYYPGSEAMVLRGTNEAAGRLEPALQAAMRAAGVNASHFAGAAGQCLKWSHFLAPAISKATGMKAWPTLGQLWKGERKVFGPTWAELDRMLEHGVHATDLEAQGRNGVDWHAWITLETGELADFTLASSLACTLPASHGELHGGILAGAPHALASDGHRFVPMLAGAAAIGALQAKSTLPLLADTVEDLRRFRFALVAVSTTATASSDRVQRRDPE